MSREKLREHWRQQVARFRESGQSVAAWCREQAIKEHQLRYWLRRLAPVETPREGQTPQWLPVAVAGEPVATGNLVIRFGKMAIEVQPGCDRALLADLLEMLSGRC